MEKLLDACCNTDTAKTSYDTDDTTDDNNDDTEFLVRSPYVTNIVRKDLAVAIRDLVHHGLGQGGASMSFVPFSGCMSARRTGAQSGNTLLCAKCLVYPAVYCLIP